jgi:deoxyribodipyrimidine photo-lyase
VHDEALQEKMRSFPWSDDRAHLEAWREGRTGYPLVDAAMRQLRSQGLVHQRAAICAASFCCFDLGLDWRLGRRVWMDEYLAADDALCDGNWQWLAGVGSDQAAYPRIYNPEKQARQYDAQAVYVRRWIPELRKLPTAAALAPWRVDRQHQIELGFFTPGQYPQRIVEHERAARELLERYRAYRESA